MSLFAWISRLCDEFPCYGPMEAYRAWLLSPPGWLEQVIEARAYIRARALFDDADTDEKIAALPKSPLMDLAIAFDFEKGAGIKADGTADDD